MPSPFDRTLNDRTGRGLTPRRRPVLRAAPRLEALESRCLLSSLGAKNGSFGGQPAPLSGTTSPAAVAQSTASSVRIGPTSEDAAYVATPVEGDTGGADPRHASYVIVPESQAPHDTFGTAQVLPDLPFFGVIGNQVPGDPTELFQLNTSAITSGLRFELVSSQSSPAFPLQFSVFDGSGRVLGTWSSGDGSISLDLSPLSPNSTLYLGISVVRSPGTEGALPPVGYQLWVTRSSTTTDSAPALSFGTGAAAASSTVFAAPFQPLSGANASQSKGDAQAAPSPTPTGPSSDLRVAVGPLPTRSAGPLGGVMAVGDVTPASPRSPLAVDAESGARTFRTDGSEQASAVARGTEASQEDAPDGLVAFRGPGGFPLLGPAAIGNWRVESPVPPEILTDAAAPEGGAILAAETLEGQAAPENAGEPPDDAVAASLRSWEGFQVSLSSGLGMAAVLTLNTLFSDPVAGFDYLAVRLDSFSRESRSSRTEPRRRQSL
jgi:hypothetical protein